MKQSTLTPEERMRKRQLANRWMETLEQHIFVCDAICCARKGSGDVIAAFREEIEQYELQERFRLTPAQCFSRCADACAVIVYPEGTWYHGVTPQTARKIIHEHLLKGKKVDDQVSYTYEAGKFNRSPLFPLDAPAPQACQTQTKIAFPKSNEP